LFPRPRLLRRRWEAFAVVVPGEDEFPGRHLGGVERPRRCVWRLDREEWRDKWLGRGWMRGKRRETSFVSPTFVAHQLFTLSRRPHSPPMYWARPKGAGWKIQPRWPKFKFGGAGSAEFLASASPNSFRGTFGGTSGDALNIRIQGVMPCLITLEPPRYRST
jgi:hypothetical protein